MEHQWCAKGRPRDASANPRHVLVYFRNTFLDSVWFSKLFVHFRGRFMALAHMQSGRACAVETHFAILYFFHGTSSQSSPCRGSFRPPCSCKVLLCVQTKNAEQQVDNKCHAECLRSFIVRSPAPLTAALACALFPQETTVLVQIARTPLLALTCFLISLSWLIFLKQMLLGKWRR